jgi:hypothetical protein
VRWTETGRKKIQPRMDANKRRFKIQSIRLHSCPLVVNLICKTKAVRRTETAREKSQPRRDANKSHFKSDPLCGYSPRFRRFLIEQAIVITFQLKCCDIMRRYFTPPALPIEKPARARAKLPPPRYAQTPIRSSHAAQIRKLPSKQPDGPRA